MVKIKNRQYKNIIFQRLVWIFSLCTLINCAESEEYRLSDFDLEFSKKIDSVSNLLMGRYTMNPGMAISVVRDGKVILEKGYGYTDIENQIPVDKKTMFYIASATKSFTGLLASILDEENIFSLNTTLIDVFPNIKFNDSIETSKITMRHLLSHTSAINNGPLTHRLAYSGQYQNDEELIELLKFSVPNGKKLGEYLYDNTGYNIYTLALKKKTGLNWKEAMKEYVLTPLKMKYTSTYISNVKEKNYELAVPHLPFAEGDSTILKSYLLKTDKTMHSAGGIISNGKDLSKWLLAHLGKSNISAKALELNHKPVTDSLNYSKSFDANLRYSLGWNIYKKENDSTDMMYHFGHFKGNSTLIFIYPKSKMGIAITSNSDLGGYITNTIRTYAAKFLNQGLKKANERLLDDIKYCDESYSLILKMYKEDIDRRNKRAWKINFSKDYSGLYHHEDYGTISLSQKKKELLFNWGNLKAIAEPYSKENTVRVEFIPKRGELIEFVMTVSGDISGLKYKNRFYKKK